MHLALTHLLGDQRYFDHYRREAIQGHYVILDNSAHELTAGQKVSFVIDGAIALKAREIVLPDYLFDDQITYSNLIDTMVYLKRERTEDICTNRLQLMIVPQARSFEAWESCTESMINVMMAYQIGSPDLFPTGTFTLGISKDYEVFEGGILRCLAEVVMPLQEKYRFSIHLLGWGRDLWKLNEIGRQFGDRIRSTDSAKPFVYAHKNVLLDPTNSALTYPGREEDYFDVSVAGDEATRKIADWNINAFELAAKGQLQGQLVDLPVKPMPE